jgi:hypothetical protein
MRDNTLTSLVILALNLDSVEAEHKAISSFLGQDYKRQPLACDYSKVLAKLMPSLKMLTLSILLHLHIT